MNPDRRTGSPSYVFSNRGQAVHGGPPGSDRRRFGEASATRDLPEIGVSSGRGATPPVTDRGPFARIFDSPPNRSAPMPVLSRRHFVGAAAAFTVTSSLPGRQLSAANANEEINLGFISCGGRAGGLMGQFSKVPGVNIAGLCDVDENRLGAAKTRFPKAQAWRDLRELIDAPGIDAVVIATCNHWHCLAAIWAMQAGKDVYVEKPLSHSQWEGRQTVAAARKYNRICQLGTQQRSDPMQAEIKKFLHDEKALGEIQVCRVNRY